MGSTQEPEPQEQGLKKPKRKICDVTLSMGIYADVPIHNSMIRADVMEFEQKLREVVRAASDSGEELMTEFSNKFPPDTIHASNHLAGTIWSSSSTKRRRQ